MKKMTEEEIERLLKPIQIFFYAIAPLLVILLLAVVSAAGVVFRFLIKTYKMVTNWLLAVLLLLIHSIFFRNKETGLDDFD